LTNLTPFTVLFGKNGSGKSLLLRAWRDQDVARAHYVVPERTGNLGFNPTYLQTQIDAQQRREQSSRNYLNEYRQHVVARVQAYFVARGASRDEERPGDPAELERLLSSLLPDFRLELVGANPPYRLERTHNQQVVADVDQLSSGEAQTLTLGLDILTIAAIWDVQGSSPRLLLVDEPDAHVHPDLQARFADFLVQVAQRFDLQVLVATHSTTLLAALGQFGGADCSVIYVDRTRSEFRATSFTRTLKELSAYLGGHALMGPLFGVPLLLVEGDDDYRIWSQVPRHHVVNFAVIPSNGEEIYQYQASLERVLGSLREAGSGLAGFALLDRDKPLPGPKTVLQEHIRFVRLECREAENLYLSNEVLAIIGVEWAAAVTAINAAAVRHGAKAAKLGGVTGWDRQSEDIKGVINEISLAIDPKGVHWTQRVGVALGRSKPEGQLAAFLGGDVLKALWR